jgi:hypothetical protein
MFVSSEGHVFGDGVNFETLARSNHKSGAVISTNMAQKEESIQYMSSRYVVGAPYLHLCGRGIRSETEWIVDFIVYSVLIGSRCTRRISREFCREQPRCPDSFVQKAHVLTH